jgi:tRNA(Leu) C34 or U34 (ribose-2'-O)-methylase TrmL
MAPNVKQSVPDENRKLQIRNRPAIAPLGFALLLKSATKAGVDVIYTLNLKHFQEIAPPDMVAKLSAP